MAMLRRGRQSIVFDRHPAILSTAAIGGKKELEGPLHAYFDELSRDTRFRQRTWEKAESKMQALALETAKSKAGIRDEDIDVLLSGDLLNQCVSSSFAVRDTDIPFLGLYGACSTMAEALLLAGVAVNSGYAQVAAAMSSSHFATAERQYRFPLGYGGLRTPTAQWTVTGAGCVLLGQREGNVVLNAATMGTVVDFGIKDAANMGAAMAPAAYHTIRAHFDDLHLSPNDFDLLVTGDLGALGKEILLDLFRRDGVGIGGVYDDCGTMIYDLQKQDVHAGGSGCGCGSVVLCGYLMNRLLKGKLRHILFCGTGALLSPLTTQQGESIPGICHAVSLGTERR
ncbi:MAG TPA: stage V sporulation protein AD [Candidatus Avoscillospira stercoripullorum]|uniref:Stage V sporulation protein AD n=1 Tax=Candidatus Avoscillospira stercoripullorum TaxID=2840709 RepID=A0A9D1A8E0_9FIRM|nr:stage V sporulation protein AD [Candidatus Avoscillospira stercoripullorum]